MVRLKRDDNREVVAGAVDTNGVIKPLLVDPTTGRLLIEVNKVAEPASPVKNTAKIDENNQETDLAYDGTDPVPLHIDSVNGYLFVDLIIG